MGKSSINGGFSIAIFNYQRVDPDTKLAFPSLNMTIKPYNTIKASYTSQYIRVTSNSHCFIVLNLKVCFITLTSIPFDGLLIAGELGIHPIYHLYCFKGTPLHPGPCSTPFGAWISQTFPVPCSSQAQKSS